MNEETYQKFLNMLNEQEMLKKQIEEEDADMSVMYMEEYCDAGDEADYSYDDYGDYY